jgi:putative sterol carrier protein
MEGRSSPIGSAEFARIVRDRSRDELAQGLEVNGEEILTEVFRRMEEHLVSESARGVDAVIEWRLTRPGGGHDRWQVVILDGSCRVVRDGAARPRVTFTIAPVDFLRLVTGNAGGPSLYVFGRLKVQGDLLFAARVPALFEIPQPG